MLLLLLVLLLLVLLLLLLLLLLLILRRRRRREGLKATDVELLHGRDRYRAAQRELTGLESALALIPAAPLAPWELYRRKRLWRRRWLARGWCGGWCGNCSSSSIARNG